jgi:hypothetical protein
MNLTSRAGGVMQKKQAFIGILLLSLALVPRTAMAELNDGSLSSTGQSTPVHQEANTDSDQRFLAAFRAAHLPLLEAIAIAERLHVGSRTAGISFDTSDNPSYRVRTVKDKMIWENVIDVRTGRTAGPETVRSLNELEMEERDNINALGSLKQDYRTPWRSPRKPQLERPSAEAWSRKVTSSISWSSCLAITT